MKQCQVPMETMPGPNRKCHAQWNNRKAINSKREHLFLCKTQDAFLCQKREDVSPHPKGEEVFLCNKNKKNIWFSTKQKKMRSFATSREDAIISQKEEMCSSAKYRTRGVHLHKSRRCVHVQKKREDVFICKKEQMCSSANNQRKYDHVPRYLDHGLMLECTVQTGATALGPRTHAETHGPRHLGHSTLSSIFTVWRAALTCNTQTLRHSGHEQIEPGWY